MINRLKKHLFNTENPVTTLALQHGQFLSRIFTDAAGRQFRLTFFVTIVDGEARGHLVSAEPMKRDGRASTLLRLSGSCATTAGSSNGVFCLPIACPQKELESVYIPAYTPIVSPYTDLYFFTSQPTRAPNFA